MKNHQLGWWIFIVVGKQFYKSESFHCNALNVQFMTQSVNSWSGGFVKSKADLFNHTIHIFCGLFGLFFVDVKDFKSEGVVAERHLHDVADFHIL